MKKFLIASLAAGVLAIGVAIAQPPPPPPPPESAPTQGPPPDWNHPPDPPSGYGDYYHDTSNPDLPARWGYRRGYDDGVADKSNGHSFRPTQGDHFKDVPEINNAGMDRQHVKNRFRDAYIHGYEHGYGPH